MFNASIKIFFTSLVIGMSLVALFISCQNSHQNEQKEKVIKAIDKLHTQFNQEDFKEIYFESTVEFRESISEKEFTEKLSTWRQKFGEIKKEDQDKKFPITIDSNAKTAWAFVINFKKDIGNLTEEFTWDISEQEAKLVKYKIFQVVRKTQ